MPKPSVATGLLAIPKSSFNYTTQAAANTAVLHADILKGDADLILPIQSDAKDVYKGFLPYINIVGSPGVVLIQRTDSIHRWSSKNILLLNAVSCCWPILMLTLLTILCSRDDCLGDGKL